MILIFEFYFSACMPRWLPVNNGILEIKIEATTGNAEQNSVLYDHQIYGIGLSGGPQDVKSKVLGINVLWVSKAVSDAARKALVQMSHGYLYIEHLPYFYKRKKGDYCFTARDSIRYWPRKKHVFYVQIAPRFPLYLIRTLTLFYPKREKHVPRYQTTWRELLQFIDFKSWPVLETIVLRCCTLQPPDFKIRDIGKLLRGEYDETLLKCWAPPSAENAFLAAKGDTTTQHHFQACRQNWWQTNHAGSVI